MAMTNEYDLCYSYDPYDGLSPNDTHDIYDEQDEESKFIIDNFSWECDITPPVAVFSVHMANYKGTNNLWYDLIRLHSGKPTNDLDSYPSELETDEDKDIRHSQMMRNLLEMPDPQYD